MIDLPLDDEPEYVAFRVLDAVIRSDPTIKAIGTTVVSWTGDPVHDLTPPTINKLPWIRLTIAPGSAGWVNEGQQRSSLVVNMQIVVAGTNAKNLINFWGAIRRAIWPTNPIRHQLVEQFFSDARVVQRTLTRAPFALQSFGEDTQGLAAEGSLSLDLFINTP